MKRLNLNLRYNPGFFNNKNDKILMQCINRMSEKIDELIDEVNYLKQNQIP